MDLKKQEEPTKQTKETRNIYTIYNMRALGKRFLVLLEYTIICLLAIASVEYFKYSTKIHYDWFHCTPVYENITAANNIQKLFAVGGPSCDKRGQLKTIVKRIGRDYPVNTERKSFCIVEDKSLAYKHYPIENGNKGNPGYFAYIASTENMSDMNKLTSLCDSESIFNI
ncbi:sphingosine N-acyltransferase subunit [Hanseniaspora uvarum]|nr:sphingosine N-acyltransferase subunit [Hanseniaspora uvarum]